ncbi:MAG: hypothetical protein A2794_05285 [Alphaproteobacteria bacterium RIFCSPHIGHO2_01_FULL_40_8]|nr:MAG: hypothetical protein A2794_05285 [Alphaproteobacteria bacterium RIFCSPHIGHO2_01_FULL_40_8]
MHEKTVKQKITTKNFLSLITNQFLCNYECRLQWGAENMWRKANCNDTFTHMSIYDILFQK